MKSIISLMLLSVLAVSCGNKNSSGGHGSSESNGLGSYSSDANILSIEEEQNLGTSYLQEARRVLLAKRKQIENRYGVDQYNTIERRLGMINIEISYQTVFDRDLGKNVNSFFDGHSMLLYVGNDLPKLNWRRILKNGDSRKSDMIYEDLISMRTNGGYRYRLGNGNGRGNSSSSSYHYEIKY